MPLVLPYQLTKTNIMSLHQLQGMMPITKRTITNVSLNTKYGVLGQIVPVEAIKIGYFGIGIKGFKNIDNANSAAPYIPKGKNLDLFEPIPFRAVPVNEDLTPAERANYRMRVKKTINDVDYWFYYLKKLTVLSTEAVIVETNIQTGVETPILEFDPSDLEPTPNLTVLEGVDSLTVKTNIYVPFSALTIGTEVIEAINILHGGNLLKAQISEIGIYTGVDRTINLTQTGEIEPGNYQNPNPSPNSNNYIESLYTHLAYHYTDQGNALSSPTSYFDFRFKIGSSNAFL